MWLFKSQSDGLHEASFNISKIIFGIIFKENDAIHAENFYVRNSMQMPLHLLIFMRTPHIFEQRKIKSRGTLYHWSVYKVFSVVEIKVKCLQIILVFLEVGNMRQIYSFMTKLTCFTIFKLFVISELKQSHLFIFLHWMFPHLKSGFTMKSLGLILWCFNILKILIIIFIYQYNINLFSVLFHVTIHDL